MIIPTHDAGLYRAWIAERYGNRFFWGGLSLPAFGRLLRHASALARMIGQTQDEVMADLKADAALEGATQ